MISLTFTIICGEVIGWGRYNLPRSDTKANKKWRKIEAVERSRSDNPSWTVQSRIMFEPKVKTWWHGGAFPLPFHAMNSRRPAARPPNAPQGKASSWNVGPSCNDEWFIGEPAGNQDLYMLSSLKSGGLISIDLFELEQHVFARRLWRHLL